MRNPPNLHKRFELMYKILLILQTDYINSIETGISIPIENSRTKRVKKPKQIEDLGFEEKPLRNNKKQIKKIKIVVPDSPVNEIKHNKKLENCQQIFLKFKDSQFYNKFSSFHKLDRQIKQGYFQNHKELAVEIRKIFNNYFTVCLNHPESYGDTFKYCNYFEDIYREYENKTFCKDSKNILELKKKMNRLRREIRERSIINPSGLKNNKLRIDINEFNLYSEREKKISKKYKMSLVKNIRSLNSDQIKGIINIIHDNLNVDDKTMEFDVNNLSMEKLRELDKYVKKCLKIKNKKNCKDTSNLPLNIISTQNNTTCKTGDNINVNININNNFMMGNFKIQNSFVSKTSTLKLNDDNNLLKKKNSILSESDSLSSSDEESGNLLIYI